jgi:ABC-type bacteriocin/lantibiotic exporter with double-glycine peptidase domain
LIKEFESGSVYYNNIDMKELDIYKIRRELFSVVPQEYILEDAELEEILNNITEARELKSNLQYKGVMDDVHKLIKKINIKVSKNEKNTYSGGENQKLSIVKAILKKSEVLIMDEPTSALDIEGTEILKEILMKLKVDKIIILISHEESMEEISDMILDLDKIKNNF